MASRSPSRGRSRTRSRTPESNRQHSSPPPEQSRSPRRSVSRPRRPRSYSDSRSRSPDSPVDRNGHRDRTRSRSPSRSGDRPYRERSYTRSLSRESRRPQSSKIVVEKLTKNVTEAHLQEIFGSYGRIQSVELPLNRQFMTNRGTAYILYDSPAASESAIAHMHEAQIDGAVITVSIVLPRRAFSRSPPPAKRASYPPSRQGPPHRGAPPGRFRSPPPRASGYGGRRGEPEDMVRNGRQHTRSPVGPRRRRRSYSDSRSRSRTPSRSPPRRRGGLQRSPVRRRRRSPSYSSYSDDSRGHSRSRSRSISRNAYGGRR